MSPKIHITKKRTQNNPMVYEVVRPHRKKLSRYKFKKQVGFAEQIMDDPQIAAV